MGLTLGLDGKTRALTVNAGGTASTISTLYIGLLQSAPTGMDGMTLSTLVSGAQGNEFTVSGSFYVGRQAITLGSISTDSGGAICYNNNGSPIEWLNSTGSTILVPAFFITNVSSGTSGSVLWVGTPDAGTATIENTKKASISANDLMLKVD